MREKETKNYGVSETTSQEKASMERRAGQKDFSKKYKAESNRRRSQGAGVKGRGNRPNVSRITVYKKRKPAQFNKNGIRIQSDRPPYYKYKEEKEE